MSLIFETPASMGLAAAGNLTDRLLYVVLAVVGAALLLAARRRLPPALTAGGWTALVYIAAYRSLDEPGHSGDFPAEGAYVLAALAVLWYSVGCGLQRNQLREGSGAVPESALVYFSAAAVGAIFAAVHALSRWSDPRFQAEDALLFLALAAVAAVGAMILRRTVDALVAAASIALAAARLVPGWFDVLDRNVPAGLALLTGGAAALISVWPAIYEWRRRRRDWLGDLVRPDEGPPRMAAARWAALALALVAGVFAPTEAEVPFALAPAGLAAMACGGVAHHRAIPGLPGVLALVFTAETAVLTFTAAVSTGPFGVLAGLSFACFWLAWMARYWSHQLLNGTAWTTAGKLVASARSVSGLAAAAAFMLAWSEPLDLGAESAWQIGLGGGLAVFFVGAGAILLFRDVRAGCAGAEPAALLSLFAALKVAACLLFVFAGRESGEFSILAAAVTLIAILCAMQGERPSLPVSTAVVGVFFPLWIVFTALEQPPSMRLLAPASVAIGAIIVLWMTCPAARGKHRPADI